MDIKIKEYIDKQNANEKALLLEARKLIFDTLPNCDEFIKWGVLSYAQGKIYLVALKGKIHIGFSIINLSKEETKLFEGTGKTTRHIKIFSLNDLEEKNIPNLIKMVNEKAGIPE